MSNESEARLQQECYIWYHNTYPHLRGLFFKIKNEGSSGISAKLITDLIMGVLKNPSLLRINLNKILDHIHNSGRIAGARDKATGLIPGVADSCLLHNRTSHFIEFKTEIGKQSPAQKEWQLIVEQAGFKYCIIRTKTQFIELCHELGL